MYLQTHVEVKIFNFPKIPEWSPSEINKWKNTTVEFDFNLPEASEPLVDASLYGIEVQKFYSQSDGLNPPYKTQLCRSPIALVRVSVAKALLKANKLLETHGIEIVLLDGYRDLETQVKIWNYFQEMISRDHRNLSDNEIKIKTSTYCWDPTNWEVNNPITWPVHMTGGAVDVTLRRNSTKEHMFMGSMFDDPSDISNTDFFEKISIGKSTLSASIAKENRRLLYHIMSEVGFSNYWAEWWHFDLGTQFWAKSKLLQNHKVKSYYPAEENGI